MGLSVTRQDKLSYIALHRKHSAYRNMVIKLISIFCRFGGTPDPRKVVGGALFMPLKKYNMLPTTSGLPKNFLRGGGSTNSVEDRENGDLGAVALPSQGFWRQMQYGTRNFISYSNFFFFFNFWYFETIYDDNQYFVIANVKQLRT